MARSLAGRGVDGKRACQIDNLYAFLRTDEISVIMPDEPMNVYDTTTVVVYPRRRRDKLSECYDLASKGERLTIDTGKLFIIFNTGREPKQHFKI